MGERRYNQTLGLFRVVGTWMLLVTLLALARPTLLGFAVGLPLVASGEALRIWAAGHLRKSIDLVTSGPYAYTRGNPGYRRYGGRFRRGARPSLEMPR